MFVGRVRERTELERLYAMPGFQMAAVCGRRRVGKTALLREFCKNKNAVFCPPLRRNARRNLELFTEVLQLTFYEPGLPPFQNWANALTWMMVHCGDKRLVLVLDEFPYLAQADPGLLAELKQVLEGELRDSNLLLILSGSNQLAMERTVQRPDSPLSDLVGSTIRLEPLSFFQARPFVAVFSPIEQVQLYGVLGGRPGFLSLVQPERSVTENLQYVFSGPWCLQLWQPLADFREEIRESALYHTLLGAIAEGRSRARSMAATVQEDVPKCMKYLRILCRLGILRREALYGENDGGRRTRFQFADPLDRFWYTYLSEGEHLLLQNGIAHVWETSIAPDLDRYLEETFAEIGRSFVAEEIRCGRIPLEHDPVGRWWGIDPVSREQVELDLVAEDGRGGYLFGMCRWEDRPIDLKDLGTLSRNGDAFCRDRRETWYVLLCRGGFTDGLRAFAAAEPHVLLYDLEQILAG